MRNCNSSYSDSCAGSTVLVEHSYLPTYPSSFDVPLIGTGDSTDIRCGTTKIVLRCSHENHKPILKPYNCTNPLCPDCYSYWIKEASQRIGSHLSALYKPFVYDSPLMDDGDSKVLNRLDKLSKHPYRHGTLSFPEHLEGVEKPYDILKLFRELSLYGVAIYHPRRISAYGKMMIKSYREKGFSGGNWEILHETGLIDDLSCTYLSPHIHFIFSGFIPEEFQRKLVRMGFVWKIIRSVGFEQYKVESLSSYLLSHAGYFGKSKSYRYFGLTKRVKVVVNSTYSKPEPVLCPECGQPMKQYSLTLDGEEVFDGYAVTSHLIYESFICIRKKVKPKVAKYSQYLKMSEELKKIIKKKEDYKECMQKKHLMLLC